MKKQRFVFCLYLIVNLLWLAFIFGHSMQSLETTQQSSLDVGSVLNALLEALSIPLELTDHMVRKTAHFVEFFLLGTLYFGWVPLLKRPLRPSVVPILFGGLLSAVCDEYIQFFAGRGSQVTDVVLDFSAVVTAVLLWTASVWLRKKRKGKQAKA